MTSVPARYFVHAPDDNRERCDQDQLLSDAVPIWQTTMAAKVTVVACR
jgi:hypothetical protein